MIRKLVIAAAVAALAGGAAFWILTIPQTRATTLQAGDAARGQTMFWAGGCGSCHAPERAKGDEKLLLGGGHRLETPFGTFVAPNISPHPEDGIGSWSDADFLNAMKAGVSPDGRHYYPAFPYASYARMTDQDVADLWAFMKTLEPVEGVAPGHELAFPFTLRRGIGLWKLMFLDDGPVADLPGASPDVMRGQYLVEGPGHCGECHTPRNLAGGMDMSRWLAGGPAPEGIGRIPAIDNSAGGLGGWSATDIAYYLESGFTPDFDSVGGSMVSVQDNMARLTAEDRAAIAAYLKALPSAAP